MPEVAEVRILMDSVEKFLSGNILTEIQYLKDSFRDKRTKKLEELDLPQQVIEVGTKGKFAFIRLANGTNIGIGFGMTGNIRIEPTEEYLEVYNKNRKAAKGKTETAEQYLKHAMLRICYEKPNTQEKGHFYYHDLRSFGFWHKLSTKEIDNKIDGFGPDILQEQGLPIDSIIPRFRRRNNNNICDALINKSDILSGIGNYIKAEILYENRVNPLCKVSDLTDEILYELYRSACRVAQECYDHGGASLYTYTGMNGNQTEYKHELRVYNKKTDPLGNVIEKMGTPDKRTTHWVPSIQTVGRRDDLKTQSSDKPKITLKLRTLQVPFKLRLSKQK